MSAARHETRPVTPSALVWTCRDRVVNVGARPLVMGILNVTPDSFSDGGAFFDHDRAVARARAMISDGADIIDVGGESTRPGAVSVSADEERRRVIPVIQALASSPDVLLSVDTMKASVARDALAAGCHIINDVSALTHDPAMVDVVRETRAGVVLMHMRGEPRTMQDHPVYTDVVGEVAAYLADRLAALVAAGLDARSLAIDPGIGFGKTPDHNVALLAGLAALTALGRPVVVGLSRKSFLGRITGREVADRLAGSLAGMAFALLNGASIVRVHDVKESCDAVRVLAILAQSQRE